MRNTITEILETIYEQCKGAKEGAVADYIPELTKADPEWYGISIVTADGYSYSIGDTDRDFTIQSISKAFTFGMALDEYLLARHSMRLASIPRPVVLPIR